MQTSIVMVLFVEQEKDVEIVLDHKDIKVSYYKDSGNGGQHRNRTFSGVRLQYNDLKIECCDTRDQRKNKEIALERLKEKLIQREQDKMYQLNREESKKQNSNLGKRGNYDRNYNFKRNSIETSDGKTLSLSKFLKGNLEEIYG